MGAFGKPVPSRAATHDELLRLAGVLGEARTGTIEVALGGSFGVEDAVRTARLSGRPVTWSGAQIMPMAGEDRRDEALRAVEESSPADAVLFPQFACRPIVNQVTLLDPFPLRSASDGFLEALHTDHDARLALYADEGWRRRAKANLSPMWEPRLAAMTVQETRVHGDLANGPTLGELAAREGTTPFDVLVDLSVADGLETRFRIAVANTDEWVTEHLLRDRRTLVGLSDAGAHVTQLCDANYATHLLGYWARERGVLPLEVGVSRLTGQPAGGHLARSRRLAILSASFTSLARGEAMGACSTCKRLRSLAGSEGGHTLWAGIACYPAHAFDAWELFDRAGNALEAAREWQQDRIEVATSE